MRTYVRLGVLLAVAGVVLVGAPETGASPGTTELVSVSSAGVEGTGDSLSPAVNEDGRYVAFVSWATNLVTGDTDACELEQLPPLPPITYNCPDIFVRDRQASTTERVNVSSGGVEANGQSWNPAISHDGRYVAFQSLASNLVSGDTYVCYDPWGHPFNCPDVFVRDRDTDGDGIFDEPGAVSTTRVSVSSGGVQGNGESGASLAISADGHFVAFESFSNNLVSPDTNNASDIFLRDRLMETTTRVSVSSGGVEGNGASSDAAISSDGRYVAFDSDATTLVSGDTNGYGDVFVRDRQMGTTIRVSLSSSGSEGNGGSYEPSISATGRYVAFLSAATTLVSGDGNGSWDIFVRDRDTDADGIFDEPGAVSTSRVSVDSAGVEGNADSDYPAISSDGRYVAFDSDATNLVSGDTDACGEPPNTYNCPDIFVRDRQTSTTGRVSVSSGGVQGNGESWNPAVNADGRYVAFSSFASNLVTGDTNGRRDVFVHDRWTPVGGIAELPDIASHRGRSGGDGVLLAALAAAGAGVLAVGTWYARRRLNWRRLE